MASSGAAPSRSVASSSRARSVAFTSIACCLFCPGVTREGRDRDRLHVDTRIAHFYPLEVFHLFGFRKIRQRGPVLVVERSKH